MIPPILIVVGWALGAATIWTLHLGNVGEYRVATTPDGRSGWVHDGTLYVLADDQPAEL